MFEYFVDFGENLDFGNNQDMFVTEYLFPGEVGFYSFDQYVIGSLSVECSVDGTLTRLAELVETLIFIQHWLSV